MYALKAERE